MQSPIVVVMLENENVDEKIRRCVKNRESRRRRQRQSGTATELQDLYSLALDRH